MRIYTEGPRIYNIFPKLFGKIKNWSIHLNLINSMGFNWIYINPLNEVGFSGSLYSIKDYFKMNPLFAENEEDLTSWNSFKTFIKECHNMEIKVMIDLVINHTAIDAIESHPSWYAKKWAVIEKSTERIVMFFEKDQKPTIKEYPSDIYEIKWQIANAYAINPEDAREIQIWGDLAEIDFGSEAKKEILEYFLHYMKFTLELGVDGYRCDAAYHVPSIIWKEIISYVRQKSKNSIFWAETLGATLKQYREMDDAGFDYITTSSKWWDFTAPWCIEQYNEFRSIAPSISFPENHDTPRLAFESNSNKDYQIFRYFFANFFSAGVQITGGYEFGFLKKLDVVNTTESDWESINFDITNEISKINQFKAIYSLLNEDGKLVHHPYGNLELLLLEKRSIAEDEQMLLIYNKSWDKENTIFIPDLQYYFKNYNPIYKITPLANSEIVNDLSINISLKPNEYLIYFQK